MGFSKVFLFDWQIFQYPLDEKGANIEEKNHKTPLQTACSWKGHLPIVQYLIEKGVNIGTKDKDELIPLRYSSKGATKMPKDMMEEHHHINTTILHIITSLLINLKEILSENSLNEEKSCN